MKKISYDILPQNADKQDIWMHYGLGGREPHITALMPQRLKAVMFHTSETFNSEDEVFAEFRMTLEEEEDGENICACGHIIKDLRYVKNVKNGIIRMVGNCCIKKFSKGTFDIQMRIVDALMEENWKGRGRLCFGCGYLRVYNPEDFRCKTCKRDNVPYNVVIQKLLEDAMKGEVKIKSITEKQRIEEMAKRKLAQKIFSETGL